MRVPTSLEDTGLLQHEPFASLFRTRHGIAGSKKEMSQMFMEKLLGKLEAEPGSVSLATFGMPLRVNVSAQVQGR